MPNGDSSDQWFLEVNGKKFGPYTMAQINALVQHHEIVGEDRVTAPHLSGKWISVQEFVSQTSSAEAPKRSAKTISQQAPAQASSPATVPPRPDERTLTSITSPAYHAPNEKRDTESKAILNLFEILQAARERKPHTPSAVGHQIVEMPRPVKSSSGGGGLLWFAVPALAVAAVITWKMSGSSSNSGNTEVAETEPSSKVSKQGQHQTASATASQPVAPRAAAPVAPPSKPKTVASLPSGFSAGRQLIRPVQSAMNDRERERELERAREREAERELEREKERETESARNYSSNDPTTREKERELERQEEREGRLPADQQRAISSSGAGAAQNNVLPVTGGTPVDPAAQFKDLSSDAENPRPTN